MTIRSVPVQAGARGQEAWNRDVAMAISQLIGVAGTGGGGGGTTTNLLTFNNGGAGAASGATFNGSAAVTVSYNTVGAAASSHTHAYSDIISVPTGSLLYRKTAGTGAAEMQTLATLKTDLGLSGTNSGDQTITLTGDVTGSGTGSFSTAIGAGKVTLAMQANVATSTVFYRKTAGSGAPEVQTLATLKTDLGLTGTNSGDQTITLTGDVTGSGTGSFATTLANSGVTAATYVLPRIVVDAKGRITSATSNNRTHTTSVTTSSTSSSIPLDGTIPQVTEGAEAMTLSITPTSTTARIRVHATVKMQGNVGAHFIAALFINGGANAVEASSAYQATATGGVNLPIIYEYVPGSTSAQTIAVRYGANPGASATVTLNQAGSQTLGGVMLSSLTAWEVA